jgi:hypothetical protein
MVTFLIGAVVGAGLTLWHILLNFKVKDKDWWEEQERKMATAHSCVKKVVAENAQLRVALAAGEMTEDAKKVATMTLASFDAVIAPTEQTE